RYWHIPDWLESLRTTENPVVPVGRKKVPAGEWWLKHPKHRWYRRVVLAPPGSREEVGPRDLNLWNGLRIQPDASASCQLNVAHVRDIICDGDPDLFKWLMNWMAALVQRPGQHAWTAPVLIGGQGVGKGHFVRRLLGDLFNPRQVVHLRK